MWSRFLARANERADEGVLRGPRGPKNRSFDLADRRMHYILIFHSSLTLSRIQYQMWSGGYQYQYHPMPPIIIVVSTAGGMCSPKREIQLAAFVPYVVWPLHPHPSFTSHQPLTTPWLTLSRILCRVFEVLWTAKVVPLPWPRTKGGIIVWSYHHHFPIFKI